MTKQGTETKARILKVTRSLLSTYGSDNATLDDILTASAISKGAFYHYFKSKESLCENVISEVIAEYHDLAESIDIQLEPIDRLRTVVSKIEELNISNQWLNCRLILRLSAQSHQSHPGIKRKLKEFWNWYTNFYEEMIEQCQQKGQLRKDISPQTQARLVMSMIAGTITLDKNLPAEPVLSEMAEVIIRGLKP